MKEELLQLLGEYKKRAIRRRQEYNLSPRPLNKEEVTAFIEGLSIKELADENIIIFEDERVDQLLLRLIATQVKRGTFPSSYAKAEGLVKYVKGDLNSDILTPEDALQLLKEMKGGAAAVQLLELLKSGYYQEETIEILQDTVLINKEEFDQLTGLLNQIPALANLFKYWAEEGFAQKWKLGDQYKGLAIKVGDNVTTGHLSPSRHANSRTDHPLHARYLMEGRKDEEDFTTRLATLKEKSKNIILVAGEALGEGSSRKSATYTMLQLLGEELNGEPEKKKGGTVIAKSMAPIFKNSLIASGILPVIADTDLINEGDQITLDLQQGKIVIDNGQEIIATLPVKYQLDKIAAGGMIYFDAAGELQKWALKVCQSKGIPCNIDHAPAMLKTRREIPQTLAQKIVALNRVEGQDTVLPGETVEVRVRGVFSQDTTGPMTLDEYQSMAGGKFGAEFVVQSLCHTGECPSSEERDRHRFLDRFITKRGGVCLKTGEGIIHTIANRFVLPTDVIVGGDSHTRTQRGISFPASSDIVAGAMKYGKLKITMDESVRVIFKGRPNQGITARDLVSTLVVFAQKSVGKGVYNGRIIEMEGLDFLNSDERYILTNAVAERSASAGTIPADRQTISVIKDNLKYLKGRVDVESSPSVRDTINSIEQYLQDPYLPTADAGAEYAATIEIPLNEVEEPLVAKPHHPDNVAPISELSGIKLDEIFIGSCVGGDIESIRAAARIVEGYNISHSINFVVSPAALDIYQQLALDGSLAKLTAAGATVIMPGCGLCMGNKRRIGSGATALTTTTRNYQSRIGPADARTYLGSAQVAAMAAILGQFPTLKEYQQMFK